MFDNKVIIDTGFVVALFNTKDGYHEAASETAERIGRYKWITTSFVIQEIF